MGSMGRIIVCYISVTLYGTHLSGVLCFFHGWTRIYTDIFFFSTNTHEWTRMDEGIKGRSLYAMCLLHFMVRTSLEFFVFSTDEHELHEWYNYGFTMDYHCRDERALRNGSRPLVALEITRTCRRGREREREWGRAADAGLQSGNYGR